MEYIDGILCISVPELTTSNGHEAVITKSALAKYVDRNRHVRVRRASPSGPALLSWNLLREDIRNKYKEIHGDPYKIVELNIIEQSIEHDLKAADYFASYELEDGRRLHTKVQIEYTMNACVLNALNKLLQLKTGKSKALGNSTRGLFKKLAKDVNDLDKEFWPHNLPGHERRLKERLKLYNEHGYNSLIHRGYGNGNSRKVNELISRLIISLYCQKNLPFGDWVHEMYLSFIAGNIEIVDKETGEAYNRYDFWDEKKQNFIAVSRSTVWNVLNNPDNQAIIDRLRNNRIDHITLNTPFNHRHNPVYSLSKISADDRTLSRKTSAGVWMNGYAIFDVMSGTCLSCNYSTDKPNKAMVYETFRQMYRTIESNNLMWPGEIEVENHLMREIEDDLKAMFTYVTFTAPGISRSKRAEHAIRALKYGSEKRSQEGIGRWNAKGAYKIKSENKDEEYKQQRIPEEVLRAEADEAIAFHNNSLHPDQVRFKGKTRWQVLVENMHPDLGRPLKYKLFKHFGFKTETSLRNNDYVRVQYQNYAIDTYNVLKRMKPNNYNVEAYYVPDEDGNINEVYLYQEDVFLTRATMIERYNEAKMERTERDEEIRLQQAKRQAHYFKRERERAEAVVKKVTTIDAENYKAIESLETEVVYHNEIEKNEVDLKEAFAKFTSESWRERKISEL